MDTDRKPRADCLLKNLPEDRQAEIADFATPNTLADTVTWLRQSGLQTTTSSLSKFLSWYHLKQQLARNESAVLSLLDELDKRNPAITAEKMYEAGHFFFASSALEKQDSRGWYLTQQVALLRDQNKLESTKYHDQLEARRQAIQRELDAAKATGGISPETFQKIERELNLC